MCNKVANGMLSESCIREAFGLAHATSHNSVRQLPVPYRRSTLLGEKQ